MKKLNIKTMKTLCLFTLAIFFLNLDLFAQNPKISKLSKEISESSGREKVDLLNKLSNLYTQYDFEKSIQTANEALKLAIADDYKKGESIALCNLGYGNYLKNNTVEAQTYFESALSGAQKNNNYYAQAYSFIGLGLIEWRQAKYNSASTYFYKAIAIAEKFNIKEMLGRAYSYLGLIYWKWTDYSKALDLYFKALKIKESIKDEFETAVTLNNIGYVYNEIKDFRKAILYSERAKKTGEKLKNDFILGRACSNLGVSYFGINEIEKAINFNKRSLEIKIGNNDKRGIGFSYIDMGNIYLSVNKNQLALENYNKAYKYLQSTSDQYGQALALSKMGEAYMYLGDFGNAQNTLQKSQYYAKRGNFKLIIAQNYIHLSEIYKQQSKYPLALEYLMKYNQVSDSLNQEQTAAKLSQLQVKYELDNTITENELLKNKNELQKLQLEKNTIYVNALIGLTILLTGIVFFVYSRNRYINSIKKDIEQKNLEIEKSRKVLEEINRNKDKFFSIISHDLRSPFQALLGYTNLLLSDYDSLTDEDRKKYILEIDSVFKSTMQLFENLLSWSRAQDGKLDYSPIIVNLYQVLNETMLLLYGIAKRKNIHLISEISQDEFVYIDMFYIQTILRNLISNSIKFTKSAGFIKVSVTTIDNHRTIVVEDSGIGMSKELANSLFTGMKAKSALGTDREIGSGIGLTLCSELVKKYGGQIWVESELGKGSKFFFTIPSE